MSALDKILKIDRRWIYILVMFAVVIPLLTPIRFDIKDTPPVRSVYEKIDNLPEGSSVLVSFDYSPGSAPELTPMAYAILRHCFIKNLRVIGMTLGAEGAALGEDTIRKVVDEMNDIRVKDGKPELQSGTDFCYLGFKAGYALVILNLNETFTGTYPSDYDGNVTNNLPIFRETKDLSDLGLLIVLASSATPENWIAYGKERTKFDMAVGCTAVSATQYYPYLDTGQIFGLMGGLKGAAEYETLIVKNGIYHQSGLATRGMSAQSIVHLMVVVLVLFANAVYLIQKRILQASKLNPGE